MPDLLFDQLAQWHGRASWGKFLDAGTGVQSLQWALSLETTSITAITADIHMRNSIVSELGGLSRQEDRILVGNWMDETFCKDLGQYDTILADYLIGAVDGFSPYSQDLIIEKLRNHLTDTGRLYIIGMQPIPDTKTYPSSIVSEVRRVRDAAILLAGQRPYREYPLDWMERHLASNSLAVLSIKKFTIMHSESSLVRQLKVGQSKLGLMDPLARQGLEPYMSQLEGRIKSALASCDGGRTPLSFDYVICATKGQPKRSDEA